MRQRGATASLGEWFLRHEQVMSRPSRVYEWIRRVGLRTIWVRGSLLAGWAGVGAGCGLLASRRWRFPAAVGTPAALLGGWGLALALDQWRWRRKVVLLRADLPEEHLETLLHELADRGVRVEALRHEPGRGLVVMCRVTQLRTVNAAVDATLDNSAPEVPAATAST